MPAPTPALACLSVGLTGHTALNLKKTPVTRTEVHQGWGEGWEAGKEAGLEAPPHICLLGVTSSKARELSRAHCTLAQRSLQKPSVSTKDPLVPAGSNGIPASAPSRHKEPGTEVFPGALFYLALSRKHFLLVLVSLKHKFSQSLTSSPPAKVTSTSAKQLRHSGHLSVSVAAARATDPLAMTRKKWAVNAAC